MGTSLRSCVEVREPIELTFGVVIGVGLTIGVLERCPRVPRGRSNFRGFSLYRFQWCICLTEMYSTCA